MVTAGHPPLAALLSALAAPAADEELAGERAAVAAFTRAQHDRAPLAAPVSRRLRRPRRIIAVLAAALIIAVGAGSAAAASGALPPGLRQRAHRLLSPLAVPGPATGHPGRAPTSRGPSGLPADPRTAPPDLGDAAATRLCQAWASEQKDPHGTHPAEDALKDLLARAGNPASVPKFCADMLGQGRGAEPFASTSADPSDGTDHTNPHPRGTPSSHG